MNRKFDAIVIGTGQSGPALAVRLAQAGQQTAIIERKLFGGTCVNVGCIPTKTLIASARAAHVARHADDYGVMIDGEIRVDMSKVKARKDAVSGQSNRGVESWLKGTPKLSVIEGHARFDGPRTVRVNDEALEADRIFINVGGRALIPDIPGLAEVDYLTNSSMMEVDFLPPHLIIVGGSYIGLEFAQMYRRFGSRVTVLENGPRIVSREDEEISSRLLQILEHEGVEFCLNAQDLRVARQDGGITVSMGMGSTLREVEGTHLLLAVGRLPNTHDLGLDRAGVDTDARGFIVVDDQLRTNVEGIYALGDANGRGAFTHTSYNDYEIVAANLLDGESRSLRDRIACYALFTDPPLARIGMNETAARAWMKQSGAKVLIGKMPMARVGRARERGETAGVMSVLIDAESKKIIGATLLGIEGDEAIHSLLDIMYAGAPYTVIQRAMHIHPTVSELIPTLLGNLQPLSP